MEITREDLENLKSRIKIKNYVDPIPRECLLTTNNWELSYVEEVYSVIHQKILAVSRINGKGFKMEDLTKDMPSIFEIFGTYRMSSVAYYKYRGFTRCFTF